MNCGKVAYPTEVSAKKALRVVQQKGGKHKEQRVYLCEFPGCRKFHLTSQPSEDERRRRHEKRDYLNRLEELYR